jgi:hypothetical protein
MDKDVVALISVIVSGLLGIAGLAFAFYTLWENRTKSYKEKLWERKVDAYAKIVATAADLAMGAGGITPDDGETLQHFTTAMDRWITALDEHRRVVLFFSEAMNDKSQKVFLCYRDIIKFAFSEKRGKDALDAAVKLLSEAVDDMTNQARKELGFPRLEKMTALLFKDPAFEALTDAIRERNKV